MTKLLISTPVHEQPFVIKNFLENLTIFVPDATIVLHVSRLLQLADVTPHTELFENVKLNPNQHNTHWCHNMSHLHIENSQVVDDWDYFMIVNSNDMFVRKGVTDYISQFDAGYFLREIDQSYHQWAPYRTLPDNVKKSRENWYHTQIEGMFFKRFVWEHIVEEYAKQFGQNHSVGASREETVFCTFATDVVETYTEPITLAGVHPANGGLTHELIDSVANGEKDGKYAVRRVLRKMGDPIRQYITELQTSV